MKKGFSMKKDHVALIVIDMQRHFCDKNSNFFVPDSDRLAETIKGLIDLFRRHDRPVIFTRHIDSDAPDNLMLRWWTEKISEKDPMSMIVDVLDVGESPVVIKHQYDGFLNTQLEKILREKSIRQVVISGVLTNLCCETTARSAFMRGFEVYFLKDGTATFTDQMHEAALLNLSYGFATVIAIEAAIAALTS
ncbi:MAG: isochorismatase family protein [candidate division WOR-3 bacterium]|nr:MAG: isochorismatase family protein [candidate division WOR-3 bacterium]